MAPHLTATTQLQGKQAIGDKCSPARQESVDDEDQIGRLLADSCAKVVVPPLIDEQQLCQACPKDGHAEQGAAEYERQEEPVVPLQHTEHTCRMLDSRLPKVMLFGQVKGSQPPGRPRKIWNDIVLSDFQQLEHDTPLP